MSRCATAAAVMDYAACNVVYVDRSAREDRLVKNDDPALAHLATKDDDAIAPTFGNGGHVDVNIRTLLGIFTEGMWSIWAPLASNYSVHS